MVFLGLGLEVADIDVAGLVARDHHDPHAREDRRSRIGNDDTTD